MAAVFWSVIVKVFDYFLDLSLEYDESISILSKCNFTILIINSWPMNYDEFEAGPTHNTLYPAAIMCYEPALIYQHIYTYDTWPVVYYPYIKAYSIN